MTLPHPATVRKPGEGRRIGIVGDVYRFLATGEDTDDKYATFEAIVPPGSGGSRRHTWWLRRRRNKNRLGGVTSGQEEAST